MTNEASVETPKWMIWAGRVMSAIPVLMLTMSAGMKLSGAMGDKWSAGLGFPAATLIPVGVVELLCVIVYLVPRTAVLGAILASCYLCAAGSHHLRLGDYGGALTPWILAVFVWGGLWGREPRLRALLPIRK